MSRLNSPVLALSLAALLWSGNFVAGRALREAIDPVTLNFLRWSAAFLLMAPFFRRAIIDSWPLLRRHWRLILALGATGIAAFQTLVYVALQTTTATNAILVLSLAPAMILLGSAITGQERPTLPQLIGAPITILGAAVVITRGDLGSVMAQGIAAGDLWMVAAVFLWTTYSLLIRRRPGALSPGVTLLASMAVAVILMAPLLPLASGSLTALASPAVALGFGYIAVGSSMIAFMLWSYGVAQIGPARAGQFVHLMPIFGAALAFVVLGEVPTLAQGFGAAVVLCGIALVERKAG